MYASGIDVGNDTTNNTNTMFVPFLNTAVLYEGYLLYSLYGVGNGPPSERFRFRTAYDRKNLYLLFLIREASSKWVCLLCIRQSVSQSHFFNLQSIRS